MRIFATFAILLAVPATALAEEPCKFSAPRALTLDLAGVKAVLFDVGSNKLHLDAAAAQAGTLKGRACAANAEQLKALTLTQKRVGDQLIVTQAEDRQWRFSFGDSYSYLDIRGSVPGNLPIKLKVGSGDVWVTGTASLSAEVGSGDVAIDNIKGQVTASAGSGDLTLHDIGALHLVSLGSGDAKVRGVRGPVQIDRIGSGDVGLTDVAGSVSVGSIGSGDLDIAEVKGGVSVDHIGSGDIDARTIGGDLTVLHKGSGDVRHRSVSGAVHLPSKD